MTPKDWTLLVLAAAGKPMSPVQLQKSLFLLSRNISSERLGPHYYDFEAYDYGPFCQRVYADAQALEREGHVVITAQESRYRQYAATPSGMELAGALRRRVGESSSAYLDEAVRWVLARTFNELVKAIYRSYPEMKVNSVFQD
jgi:hypothetical protein